MNIPFAAAFVVAITAFVVLRLWLSRRIVAGNGRAVWLVFGFPLVGFAVLIWAGLTVLGMSPLAGIGLIALGSVLIGGLTRALHRSSVGVTEASTPEERAWQAIEGFESYQILLALVVLFGGLIAVVALIWFGLSTR